MESTVGYSIHFLVGFHGRGGSPFLFGIFLVKTRTPKIEAYKGRAKCFRPRTWASARTSFVMVSLELVSKPESIDGQAMPQHRSTSI
jgi:hypothetical protein